MANAQARIMLVDDHPIVLEGLKRVISEALPAVTLGVANSGMAAIEMAKQDKWDMIVLDISLPDRSGLDLLKQFKQIANGIPVLVLSIHPEEQYALRVIKAGASGYLTKDSVSEKIHQALLTVLGGGRYVSPNLADRLALALTQKEKPEAVHEALSDRELQVLCMIASGKGVKEIGDELSLSVKTVSTYRARILEKMGRSNNAELIHYAIMNNLVPDSPRSGRRHERFRLAEKIFIASKNETKAGQIKNISLGGACLENTDPLQNGEFIGFSVVNSQTKESIEGEARVVWTQDHRAGIKFCNPAEQMRKTIYKWSRNLDKEP